MSYNEQISVILVHKTVLEPSHSVNRDLNSVYNLRTLCLRKTNARGHCIISVVGSSIVATVVETRIEIMRNYAHI